MVVVGRLKSRRQGQIGFGLCRPFCYEVIGGESVLALLSLPVVIGSCFT